MEGDKKKLEGAEIKDVTKETNRQILDIYYVAELNEQMLRC